MIKIAPLLMLLLFGWLPVNAWQSCSRAESNHSTLVATASDDSISPEDQSEKVRIPFLGEVDPTQYALPVLAVLLGLIDGFNPCAMWALVYLISLIIGLNDRTKIWFLVGSFVLASGILYFLFMTAWLGAFLVIGYYRPLTLAIGVVAMVFGLHNLFEVARAKGALICTIGDHDSKQKTQEKMRSIVLSPLTLTTMLAIIGLAFLVNSIEFLCSSAIPAVFTHVLAVSNLSWIEYYGYILLYDFFFMLDDMIIFGVAAFTISTTTSMGERYVKFSKIVGGFLLIAIGLLLVFMPEVLR
jgi:cytochrome c biogenesis protein CcdA